MIEILLRLVLTVMAPPTEREPTCHGHAAVHWDAYKDASVLYFEVQRSVHGLNAWSVAGDTKEKNREGLRAETWDVLRAWSIPAEGVRYDYRVVAVRGSDGVKATPSNVTSCGPQDPTKCYPVRCP